MPRLIANPRKCPNHTRSHPTSKHPHVGPNAPVGLTPTLDLNYQNPFNFQDIQLSGKASVDVSGPGGGNIAIQARQVTVGGGSAIVSQKDETLVERLQSMARNLFIFWEPPQREFPVLS